MSGWCDAQGGRGRLPSALIVLVVFASLATACRESGDSQRDPWAVSLVTGDAPVNAVGPCDAVEGALGRFDLDQDWRVGVAVGAQGWTWEGPLPDQPWQLEASLGSVEAARVEIAVSAGGFTLSERLDLTPNRWSEVRLLVPRGGAVAVTLRVGAMACPVVFGAPFAVQEGRPGRPSVLLVSADTLRADRLGSYGYPRPTSELLDAWAASHAVRFDQAVAQSTWTLPSHASMLTGVFPWRHGANWNDASETLPHAFPTLAETLAANGYRTVAVTAGGFVHPRYGFARGFESYRYWGAEDPGLELADGLARALSVVDDDRSMRPLFLFFHTYETHMPYQWRTVAEGRGFQPPTVSAREVLAEAGRPTPTNGFLGAQRWWVRRSDGSELVGPDAAPIIGRFYDSAVVYLDEGLDRLLRAFSRRQAALTIVTSDHGESLGEGGVWSHSNLTEANLRVPLLVSLPDQTGAGSTVTEQVELVDIFPTVLQALGIQSDLPIDGRVLPGAGGAAREPRAAVSWAATNNRGFAIRLESGRKLIFRDSVWSSPEPTLQLARWREDPHDLSWTPLPASQEEPEELRRLSREVLRTTVGTVLQIRNRGARRWELLIQTDLVDPVSVKSFDLEAGRARWGGMGRLFVDVAAGRAPTILLARTGPERLVINFSFAIDGCSTPAVAQLDRSAYSLVGPTAIEVVDSECRVGHPSPGAARSGVTVVHRRASGAVLDPELTAEHRRQLEALGYLN